jgi:hypothetical protein
MGYVVGWQGAISSKKGTFVNQLKNKFRYKFYLVI